MKVRQLITALKKAKKNAEVYIWDGDTTFRVTLAYSSSTFAGENPINKHDDELWLDISAGPYPADGVDDFIAMGVSTPPPRVPCVKVMGPVSKVRQQHHKRRLPVIAPTPPETVIDRAMRKVKTEGDEENGPVVHERGKV